MEVEYVVVGSGLTGAVIARQLADAGKTLVVVERRSRVGGNCADQCHPSGIRYHLYGPHYFRTNSAIIWNFVLQAAHFFPFRAAVKTLVNGEYFSWPIAGSVVRSLQPNFVSVASLGKTPANFEEAALTMMPEVVYRAFVKEYTEKQWGRDAAQLSAELCRRFSIHWDDSPYLKSRHKYQGLPLEGYSFMIENLLRGVPVVLNADYLKHRRSFRCTKKVVFTGPIDEYFDFCLGRLEYRAQRRRLHISRKAADSCYLPRKLTIPSTCRVRRFVKSNGNG